MGLWVAFVLPDAPTRLLVLAFSLALALVLARGKITLATMLGLAAIHLSQALRAPAPLLSIPNWVTEAGFWSRARVLQVATGISKQATALALGLTDGDTSLLSKSVTQELKTMSLTHLTAVSGTNCSILLVVVMAIATGVGFSRRARLVFMVGVLLGYLVLVGDQPSVVRAAVMALVAVAGITVGLRVPPVNLLAIAVYLVLLLDPGYALSYGFALSVSATAGVLLLAPGLAERMKLFLGRNLALALAVAISAQVACLPILVSLQSSFNLAGVVANLVAEPLVAPATVLGVLAATLALIPIGAAMASACFWLASIPTAFILSEAHFLAVRAPSLTMPSGVTGFEASILLLLALIGLLIRQAKGRLITLSALVMTLVLLAQGLRALVPNAHFLSGDWFMVACDVGQGDATVIRAGNRYAVIDVGRDPDPINRCLNRLGVNRIDLLELTHFDMDHVGGLGGALEGRTVARALLTQYVDSRPGAFQAEQLLKARGIPTTRVALGDTGWLGSPNRSGSFSWLVLSPHPGGADAQSSNEGSISMFWTNQRVAIFTMADLPAVGQQRLMDERPQWWRPEYARVPTVLKLSHHGSADQDPEFLAWVHPTITTISVGVGNSYGHPTKRALEWLKSDSLLTLRTDQLGSLAISQDAQGSLAWSASSAG